MNFSTLAADPSSDPRYWTTQLADASGSSAVLIAARAVGHGATKALLDRALEGATRIEPAEAQERSREVDLVLERSRTRGMLVPERALERVAEAIWQGAEPSYLFRAAAHALDTEGLVVAAESFARAALAIAADDRGWYRDTLALVLINQGRFDEAKREIELLRHADEGQAHWLDAYLTSLATPFTFWLKPYVDLGIADDATETARTLQDLHAQISRCAGRVEVLVARCRARAPSTLVLPSVAELAPETNHDFESGPGLADNLLLLRKEWTRLCWLIVVGGGAELRLPATIAKPPDPLTYLETIATVRFNLLVDRSEAKVLVAVDKLDEEAMALKWGGVAMSALAPHLAGYWLEEVGAFLAVVRWALGTNATAFEDP